MRAVRKMLSSTAKNLYWMGRYLQRAKSTARLIEATQRMALQSRGEEAAGVALIFGMEDEFRQQQQQQSSGRPRPSQHCRPGCFTLRRAAYVDLESREPSWHRAQKRHTSRQRRRGHCSPRRKPPSRPGLHPRTAGLVTTLRKPASLPHPSFRAEGRVFSAARSRGISPRPENPAQSALLVQWNLQLVRQLSRAEWTARKVASADIQCGDFSLAHVHAQDDLFRLVILLDVHFPKFHSAFLQEHLHPAAIRAPRGAVDYDWLHSLFRHCWMQETPHASRFAQEMTTLTDLGRDTAVFSCDLDSNQGTLERHRRAVPIYIRIA